MNLKLFTYTFIFVGWIKIMECKLDSKDLTGGRDLQELVSVNIGIRRPTIDATLDVGEHNITMSLDGKSYDKTKLKRIASDQFSSYLRAQIKKYAAESCRRTGGYRCNNERSLYKTECGLFCVNDDLGCFMKVLDFAVSTFDILSNFIPPMKCVTAVKTVGKALKTSGRRAAIEAVKKESAELGRTFLGNLKKMFDMKDLTNKMIDFVASDVTGELYHSREAISSFLDAAMEEATQDLAYEQILQVASNGNRERRERELMNVELSGKGKVIKDYSAMSDEQSDKAVLDTIELVDPTGVLSFTRKFMGAKCTERELDPPFRCYFQQQIQEMEKGHCCSGISSDRGVYRLYDGKRYVLCNLIDGTDGCDKVAGVKVTAKPETFVDAQLDFNTDDIGGSTKGLYFQIHSRSEWEDYFPERGYCHVFYDRKYKECYMKYGGHNLTDPFCKILYGAQYNPVGEPIPGYLQKCLQSSTVYLGRQCRKEYVVWEGEIRVFEEEDGKLFGRRSGYIASNFEWETGDVIVPYNKCCPVGKENYKPPPPPHLGACQDNENWESLGLGCDWVAKDPVGRCNVKSTFGILASDVNEGCRRACECVLKNKPSGEPPSGVRVLAHVRGGSKNGRYFKLANEWAMKAWSIMGLNDDEVENGDHHLLDVQQCRDGKQYLTGSIRVYEGNPKEGDWAVDGEKGDWHDGDVIVPLGLQCKNTIHSFSAGIIFNPTTYPSANPSTNPSNEPTTSANPTSTPSTQPTISSLPTVTPSYFPSIMRAPNRGVQIDIPSGGDGSWFFVPKANRWSWNKMKLGTKLQQCRNGRQVWSGNFFLSIYIWQGRRSSGYNSGQWKCGDTIIKSNQDCGDTIGIREGDTVSCGYDIVPTPAPMYRGYGIAVKVEAIQNPGRFDFIIPFNERRYWDEIKDRANLDGYNYRIIQCRSGDVVGSNDANCIINIQENRGYWTDTSECHNEWMNGDLIIPYTIQAPCPPNRGVEVESYSNGEKFLIPEANKDEWFAMNLVNNNYGELQQCRNGRKIWEGEFYINYLLQGRRSTGYSSGQWQCGDVIIKEGQDCGDTYWMGSGQTIDCSTRLPTSSPTRSQTRSPTRSPTRPHSVNCHDDRAWNTCRYYLNSGYCRWSSFKNVCKKTCGVCVSSQTRSPTKSPTRSPTKSPTRSPTKSPTRSPTVNCVDRLSSKTCRDYLDLGYCYHSFYKDYCKKTCGVCVSSQTRSPTKSPTRSPTKSPKRSPTRSPTRPHSVICVDDWSACSKYIKNGYCNTWLRDICQKSCGLCA